MAIADFRFFSLSLLTSAATGACGRAPDAKEDQKINQPDGQGGKDSHHIPKVKTEYHGGNGQGRQQPGKIPGADRRCRFPRRLEAALGISPVLPGSHHADDHNQQTDPIEYTVGQFPAEGIGEVAVKKQVQREQQNGAGKNGRVAPEISAQQLPRFAG